MSREKIQQLLTAIGSEPKEDAAQVDAADYNWQEPHYFNNEQLAKLDHFANVVASGVSQKFAKLCRSEFDVTISSTTQHYVEGILGQLSDGEQMDYYLPFGADQEHMFGLVGIPWQSAFTWARQLLGDSESEKDSSKNLSQLEESLLLDLASALVEIFSGPDKSFDFHPATRLVRGQWPLELKGTEEICKISVEVKQSESEKSSEAYFLIKCSELVPVTGTTGRDSGGYSADDISKLIMGHLQEMPVLITGQLGWAELSFEDLMDLQPDDILLLDKRVDQPVELIVDGRTIYYGRPAKSDGKYAVSITTAATALEDNP